MYDPESTYALIKTAKDFTAIISNTLPTTFLLMCWRERETLLVDALQSSKKDLLEKKDELTLQLPKLVYPKEVSDALQTLDVLDAQLQEIDAIPYWRWCSIIGCQYDANDRCICCKQHKPEEHSRDFYDRDIDLFYD